MASIITALRQRRDMRILTGAASYAAHQRFADPVADWEMQRAARTELLPVQPEPALFCAAEDAERPLTMPEVALIVGKGFAAMALMLAFGYWTAPAMVRLLAAMSRVLAALWRVAA